MQFYDTVFVPEKEIGSKSIRNNTSLIANDVFWASDKQNDDDLYEQIVFNVLRKPTSLISHIQRITFTHSRNMNDHLYAALVDLFYVLRGKGVELSHRMASLSYIQLTEEQSKKIKNYLNHPDVSTLSGNRFSVLTTGLTGVRQVVIKNN